LTPPAEAPRSKHRIAIDTIAGSEDVGVYCRGPGVIIIAPIIIIAVRIIVKKTIPQGWNGISASIENGQARIALENSIVEF